MSSSNTKSDPSVLFIGLPPHHPMVGSPELQDKIEKGLAHAQQLADSAGVHMTQLMIAPEELPRFREALQKETYDAVIIGNGVRSNMELTPHMEKIIATVVEVSPKTAICFNTTPDDSVDAVRRWFPHVKKA